MYLLLWTPWENLRDGIGDSEFHESTCEGHRMPRYLIKQYFWVCLRYFWRRLIFELVDWVKRSALPDVSRYRPVCWESEWRQREAVLLWFNKV
jgi:hypothetical protein